MNYEPTWLEAANSMVRENVPGISGCFESNIVDLQKNKRGYDLTFGIGDSIGNLIASQMFGWERKVHVVCLFMDIEAMDRHKAKMMNISNGSSQHTLPTPDSDQEASNNDG